MRGAGAATERPVLAAPVAWAAWLEGAVGAAAGAAAGAFGGVGGTEEAAGVTACVAEAGADAAAVGRTPWLIRLLEIGTDCDTGAAASAEVVGTS